MILLKQALLFFLFAMFCAIAFADGIPINPYDYHLEELKQESQIAYIDFDGKKSTVSLFVEFDFSSYNNDELIWIVPFKDIPDNVNLEETTFYKFQQDFSAFDKELENAVRLKKAYEGDLPGTLAITTALHYFPVGALFLVFIVSSPAGTSPEGIAQVEKSFDFGSLGRADVYKISDKATLQQFFQEKGMTVPAELGSFLDKHIVVFRINKTREKLKTLVTFEFSNSSELFYPSSTTDLWKGTPSDYIVKVRAPLHFKLSPNIKPNLEINDLQHQYFIFSPSCIGLSGYEYMECRNAAGLPYWGDISKVAVDYREKLANNPKLKFLVELYDTDLQIAVKEERTALPVGMLFTSAINPWILAIGLIFASWIIATLVYSVLKKKYNRKEIVLIGLTMPIVWTAINICFSILFTLILIILFLSVMPLGYLITGPAIPIIFLADLAITIFAFKKLVVDRFDKIFAFPKGKVTFQDFVALLLTAFVVNIILAATTLFLFSISI